MRPRTKMTRPRQMSITADEATRLKIQYAARKLGITQSELVRQILDKGLDELAVLEPLKKSFIGDKAE